MLINYLVPVFMVTKLFFGLSASLTTSSFFQRQHRD